MRYLLIALLLTGCSSTTIEYSEIKQEKIKVVDIVYTPATHSNGNSVGFTTSGDFTYSNVNVGTEPVYAIVFQCIHGKFIVFDSTIWANVNKDDTGVRHYNEQFEVEMKNDVVIAEPTLVKYNLLDVVINGETIIHE